MEKFIEFKSFINSCYNKFVYYRQKGNINLLFPDDLLNVISFKTCKHSPCLKGLGDIVQMRDRGAMVVTAMLDVQLKII